MNPQVSSTPPSAKRMGRPPSSEGAPIDRERVVAAAVRAVRRDGPQVTMTAIANEAGVSKPIVYRTVGDKEAVAEALAEFLSLRVEQVTAAIIDRSDDPREQFRAAARAYFDLVWEDRHLFLFVEHGWGSHDGHQLETMIERAAAPFIDRDQAFGGPGERRSTPNRTWSYAAIGAMRTVAVMWVRNPYCDVDQVADDVTDFVFRTDRSDR